MSVQRVHELIAWVESGAYDRIVGGEYPRRDEPATPGRGRRRRLALLRSAARHLPRAAESVEEAAKQLNDWLRKRRDDDE